MTAYTRIRFEPEPPVARITLARPEVRNAFDDLLIVEVSQAAARLVEICDEDPDKAPRALVLTGEGASFCAGADMNWMRRSISYTEEENLSDARRMAAMYRALDELPLPTIARVNGHALGGGMGLIACCDMVVAADSAQFGFTEAKLGIAPAIISSFVLPKIGAATARRYFLTAELFDARRALDMGLVHEVVPAAELDAAVDRLVTCVRGNGPRGVSAAKRLIRETLAKSRDDALENAVRTIAALRASPEGQEGLGAFLEKRPPAWKQ